MRLLLFCFFAAMVSWSQAETIIVCPNCKVNQLSQAVQMAKSLDTVWIKTGNYLSVNTVIDKPLTVIGEGYPVLDGQHKDDILTVTADSVTIKGLELRNTNVGSMKDYAGIRVVRSKDVRIMDCRLFNTYFGVYLSNTTNTLVKNIQSIGTDEAGTNRGNGIHLWKCYKAHIENNRVENHRDGIYFEFSKHCLVQNNWSTRNIRYGLHFMFSDSNSYIQNTFKNNGTGVAVMYTDGVTMYENVFEDNWGDAAYGLLLKDINNSIIVGNTFRNNTIAITMEGSSRMRFEKNDFIKNGYALKVMANCVSDTFRWNNFIGNTFDAGTNGQLSGDLFAFNYWDKYKGYDLNRDRIGDIPYKPVSLYSIIIENMPYAVMLLRSFIVDLLNQAEKSIPGIVPNTFEDTKPLMKKIER